MYTISISAQKGGVGKSTTTAILAAMFAHSGKRVLIVDSDPQGNLSTMLEADCQKPNLADLLTRKTSARKAIQKCAYGSLISGGISLADKKITARGGGGFEYALKSAIMPISGVFDVCLIDCPPSLGSLTIGNLAASDAVIIPVKADRFSLMGLNELMNTVDAVKETANTGLKILGVIVAQYDRRTTVAKLSLQAIKNYAAGRGIKIYSQPIRRSTAIEELQYTSSIEPSMFKKIAALRDYEQLFNELQEQIRI